MLASQNGQVTRPPGNAGKTLLARGVIRPGFARIMLPGVPEAVGGARRLAGEVLQPGWQADSALTCLSELVANAIQHTRSGEPGRSFVMLVRRLPDGSALVSVWDEGVRTVQDVGSDRRPAGHGCGLAVVAMLSEQWGVERLHAGRRTWCRIAPAASYPSPPADARRDRGTERRVDIPA